MKKITLLLFLFLSVFAFAQVIDEDFEDVTFPPTGWTMTTNGVGSPVNPWTRTTNTALTNTASVGAARTIRQTTAVGQERQTWLITPQILVPTNGQLRFFTRNELAGNQGTNYSIRISTNPDPTNLAAYTTVETWTELTLVAQFDVYEEKIVSLTGNVGNNVYIAFVRSNVQAIAGINGNGDNWLVDDVVVIEQCLDPTALSASSVLSTSATLNWTDPNGATEWTIEYGPLGFTPGTGTIVTATTNPFPIENLTPATQYSFYVQSNCSDTNSSAQVGPQNFTTQIAPPVCGGQFFDSGGPTANYAANTNETVTITPINPTDIVTVTFTAFHVENRWDALYVFQGIGTGGPQISSGLGLGLGPNAALSGGFWSSTANALIPGPFESAGPGQSLTFQFISDGSFQFGGWIANVTCTPAPSCPKPTALTISDVTGDSATATWTENGSATIWEYLLLPCGSPEPDATTTGFVSTTTNPLNLTSLTSSTCYTLYVRAVCGPEDTSLWSVGSSFTTTQIPVPLNYFEDFEGVHGWTLSNGTQTNKWVVGTAVSNSPTTSLYVSNNNGVANAYSNNAASVVHAYRDIQLPAIAGEINVSFDWRNVGENNFDFVRVWLVPSTFVPTPGTQITVANSGGQQLGGNFQNNANFTTANFLLNATAFQGQVRRLIFEWRNDGIIGTNPPGAIDNVDISLITCPAPNTLVATDLEPTSLTLGWSEIGTATTWQILTLPCNSPAPTDSATGWIEVNANPHEFTDLDPSTCYTYYVRSICGVDDISFWSQPLIINTPQIPVELNYAEDFENIHGWTLNNGNQTNKWVVGTAVSSSPTHSLYISNNNGTSNTYTNTISVVQAYRDLAIPDGAAEINVSFDWRNDGENNFDYIRVWLVPITYQPVAGVQTTIANSGGQQLGGNFQDVPAFTSANFVLNSAAFEGTTMRLLFEWRNDGSGGTQPPAAIDNVKVDYALCERPTNLVVSSVGTYTAEISWTDNSGATQWHLYVVPIGSPAPDEDSAFTLITENPYTIIDLVQETQYQVWIRGVCEPVGGVGTGTSLWTGPATFTTLPTCPQPINLGTENNSGTSVDLVWTPQGVETQWEVVYQLQNGPLPTNGVIVNTNPTLTVNDVSDGGIYEFYVRSICGDNDLSQWSGPFTFVIFNPESCATIEVFDFNLDSANEIFVCEDSDGCVDLSANYLETSAETTSYAVESIDYEPPFPFLGGSQLFVNTDDVWSSNISLPFDFCFYGQQYTNALVGANGAVHFGNTYLPNSFCPWAFNTTIPNAGFPIKNAIFGVYQDIDPGIDNNDNPLFNPNINYQVLGSYPCRALVVNFSDVAQFSGGCQNATIGGQTTQIVIYEITNIIEVYIQRRVPCTSWQSGNGVVGLINSTGTQATVPPGRNTGAWSAFNEAWRFTPNGESNVVFEWLKNGDFYSNDTDITVCIDEASVMTARATYTSCVGDDYISEADVNISFVDDELEVQEDVLTCGPFELPILDVGNYFTLPDGEGDQLNAGDFINSTQTVYVYATFPSSDGFCESQGSFEVEIVPLEAIEFEDVVACGSYTLGELPVNYQYFTESGGLGTELFEGDVVNITQEIYLYLTLPDNTDGCFAQSSFIVTIVPAITFPGIEDVNACDEYVLPSIMTTSLVTNGDFSSGNLNFTTDYNFTPVNPAGGQGLYTVGTNPQGWFNAFAPCTDHTTGDGNMLIVDGSTQNAGEDKVWCQTITVVPNQNYTISYWVQTIALPNAATIETRINGVVVGSSIAPSTTCTWVEHSYTWNSGNNTSAEICLYDTNIAQDGNDFALDDISFALQTGTYYTGPGGTGDALAAGTVLETDQQLWIYTSVGPCTAEITFAVNIDSATADQLAPVTACDSYELQPLSAQNNYYTGPGGTGDLLTAGQAVTSTQTLYVYAVSADNPLCTDESTFEITISDELILEPIQDVMACDSYTLPELAIGSYYTGPGATGEIIAAGTVLVENQQLWVYASIGSCTAEISFTVSIDSTTADQLAPVTACDSYELQPLSAENNYYTGPGGTGDLLTAGQFITSTQTLYVYAVSANNPLCTEESTFEITINNTPVIAPIADVVACDSYILPALTVGNYYTATGGTGTMLAAGDQITTTQTLFVYADNAGCIAQEQSFTVTIPIVNADVLEPVTECDSYELQPLSAGNTYYTGPGGTGDMLAAGSLVTSTQTIYIQAASNTTPVCTDESSFVVTINNRPVIAPIEDVVACDTYELPALAVGNYYTASGGTGTMLATGAEISSTQTLFVYANNAGCDAEQSFTVTIPVVSVETLPDVEICDVYFLPALTEGNYYTRSGGVGVILMAGAEVTESQTIYIYQAVPNTDCFAESSFDVSILACQIPRGISPNNDGFNDTLDLTNFDVKYISIYNRHGREVYSQRDYTDQWFGQSSSGDELPDGTYFYNVERNNGENSTGWIYINREL